MSFNSIEFLWFLPIVFAGYWMLRNRLTAQNVWIVAAGFLFYGWWDWRFLGLICATILVSWLSGLGVAPERGFSRSRRKWIVAGSVAFNLGILVFFKYFGFFADALQRLFAAAGIELGTVTLRLVLPIGISFYTFQAIAYTVDVYKGRVQACKNLLPFAAFISFFPQLVAGPIERASNLLPQFLRKREFDYGLAVDGCRQILWGLFKKIVIADHCAYCVNKVFSFWDVVSSADLWLGALLFTFQVYCDFSGYSDMAVGLAKLFGIRLSANFRTPFFSRSIGEFWRRWHITLSQWFRDYVYIPLGGNRKGRNRQGANIMNVFLLSGLWHGAGWTFVAWGGLHGLYQLPAVMRGKKNRPSQTIGASWADVWRMLFTFLLVVISFIPFRAVDLSSALGYVGRMFSFRGGIDLYISFMIPLAWCALLVVVDWVYRNRDHGLQLAGHGLMKYAACRWILYFAMALVIIFFPGQSGQFIYFQF